MKQNINSWLIGFVVVVIIGIGFLVKFSNTSSSPTRMADTVATQKVSPQASENLPGLQTGVAPWIAETDNLKARLQAIGLPALATEGTTLHTHQHLDIYVHNKLVPVAAGIGINSQERFISPIHVHDTTSVIHVESPKIQDFTLGQFFDIWGVRFTVDCIGGYCSDKTNSLLVFVNGKKVTTDPRNIVLAPHQEIAIVFGTPTELPKVIPASFVFPAGE